MQKFFGRSSAKEKDPFCYQRDTGKTGIQIGMTKLYPTILTLVVLSVIVFTGVDIFYKIVRSDLGGSYTGEALIQEMPEAEFSSRSSVKDFRSITVRNLFGSTEVSPGGMDTEEIEALEPTSLKIALLGTVTGSRQNAYAVIEEVNKRRQGLYRVGDSIQDAVVKMILREKVVLRVGAKDEVLEMEEQSSPGTQEGGTYRRFADGKESTIAVKRSDIRRSLRNINKLLSQIRVQPHLRGGRSDGLSVGQIKPGSIFEKMGLRNGDIVKGIDGRPIKKPDDIISLYEKLKSGSRSSVAINRRGKIKIINYTFR